MKKKCLIVLLVLFAALILIPCAAYAAGGNEVVINATNFPDENFRSYISEVIDANGNGVLNSQEIKNTKGIYVYDMGIKTLEGLKYFTEIEVLGCDGNLFTALDVSANTKLTDLYCSNNKLTSLDLSKNTQLAHLYCNDTQLKELDLSNNTVMADLECRRTDLKLLNVSKHAELSFLDVRGSSSLKSLYCEECALTYLNVTDCTALETLQCSENNLAELDLSGVTTLKWLWCWDNSITSLDLSKNTVLERLDCGNNQLKKLDVSKNTALKDLACYVNELTALDVSKNAALETLYCYDNSLTSLNVGGHSSLTTLYCGRNTALKELYCNECALTTLDIAYCNALTFLNCRANPLKSIDLGEVPALEYLYCGECDLSSLDLRHNNKLVLVYCIFNPITDLDVSECTKLQILACFGCKLGSLDISYCPELIKSYIEGPDYEDEYGGANIVAYQYDPDFENYYLHVDKGTAVKAGLKTATVTGISLNLQEKISVQFKVKPDADLSYAELRVQNPDGSFAAPVKVVLNKSDTSVYKAGEDRFVVRYSEITTKMISQGIKLTIYGKDGKPMDIYRTTNEATYTLNTPLVYSAADWCDAAVAKYGADMNNKTSLLAMSVLNLGAEAQSYFDNYNPAHPANPNGYLSSVMAVWGKDTAYDLYMSDANAKNKGYSSLSLDLAADTRLRVKFTANTTVTVDGKKADLVKEGDKYVLDITGLRCIDLDQMFTVAFKATDGSTITLKMYALSWCNAAMDKYADEPKHQTVRLAKAVCIYSAAAEYYFN